MNNNFAFIYKKFWRYTILFAKGLTKHGIAIVIFLFVLSAYFALHDSLKQNHKIVIFSVLVSAIVVYASISNRRHGVRIALPLIIAIVTCAAFASRKLIYNIGYDTWMHLSLIQNGIEKGLFPGEPYYAHLSTPPHYSLVDIIHSALSFIFGIRPHILWGIASPFLLAMIGIATFYWVKELTQDAKIGLVAMIFALFAASITWHYATYPRNTAIIFYAYAHLFYFRCLRNRRIRDAILSGVFFGLCIMTHLFTGVACLLSLLSYVVIKFVVDVASKRSLRQFISYAQFIYIPVGFVVASPWLILYTHQFFTRESSSPAHYQMLHQDNLLATIGGTKLFSFKRELFFDSYHNLLWILAAIGLLICLYKIIKNNSEDFHVFLIATAITPMLILLTPLYMVSTKIFGAWMTPRFMQILPVPILAALAIRGILTTLTKDPFRILKTIAAAGALLGVFVILFIPVVAQQMDLHRQQNGVLTPLDGWDADFDEMKEMIKGKVVLSDIWTSYFLPYYTGAYVVAIPAAHGSPFVDQEKRTADIALALNPATSFSTVMELLKKYEVEYLLLNLRPKLNPNFSKYSLIASQYPGDVLEIFSNNPLMQLVYQNDGVWLYQLVSGLKIEE